MKNRSALIFIHIIGSLLFLALPIIFSPNLTNSELFTIPPFQRDLVGYFFLLSFFYFNYYLLIPKFYFSKSYFIYFCIIIICYGIVISFPSLIISSQRIHDYHSSVWQNHEEAHTHIRKEFQHRISHFFFQYIIVIIFSFLLRLYGKWKQTEKEKTDTELSYLKAQINPHFLFNTLNSIYSLAIEEKSEHTADAVLKLSGMMRYVMSETESDYVSLEKEINYISDYIELQKIRLGSTVNLSYSVTGNTLGNNIAPLLLITFIENAFKHGVNPEAQSTILINIAVNKKTVTLKVENNKVNTEHYPKNGLGIENIKNRLQLLYPSHHELIITDNEKEFHISLTINLQ